MRDRVTDHDIIGTRPRPAPITDGLFAPPVSRSTDPTTSHEAEAKLSSRDAIIRRVVEAHADAGGQGLTADECADIIGIDGAWKRCSDAVSMGFLWENGDRRSGKSGRAQVVRVITAHGLRLVGRVP
jgi:hypothetical protein